VRTGVVLALALTCVLAGCGGGSNPPVRAAATHACLGRAGWQALANRIGAPVYCPGWMPDPLDGRIGGRWNTIDSVDRRDHSYLIGFIWQEVGSGELHVNLRGYPGRTRIPTCTSATTGAVKERRSRVPCFADPHGTYRVPGIQATLYTANQDADLWHLLYAWRRGGALYTLSQHVAAPLNYAKVRADLQRMLRELVLVRPRS
jgi:hypothetical protein